MGKPGREATRLAGCRPWVTAAPCSSGLPTPVVSGTLVDLKTGAKPELNIKRLSLQITPSTGF